MSQCHVAHHKCDIEYPGIKPWSLERGAGQINMTRSYNTKGSILGCSSWGNII